MPINEVMEKFAILSYILDNDWLGYLQIGINIWEHTIFDEYFKKKFGGNYLDQVTHLFLVEENKYREQFNLLSNKMIESIPLYQNNLKLDKNPEAWHNLEEGKVDDSLGLRSKFYNKKMKELKTISEEISLSEINADPMTKMKESN